MIYTKPLRSGGRLREVRKRTEKGRRRSNVSCRDRVGAGEKKEGEFKSGGRAWNAVVDRGCSVAGCRRKNQLPKNHWGKPFGVIWHHSVTYYMY